MLPQLNAGKVLEQTQSDDSVARCNMRPASINLTSINPGGEWPHRGAPGTALRTRGLSSHPPESERWPHRPMLFMAPCHPWNGQAQALRGAGALEWAESRRMCARSLRGFTPPSFQASFLRRIPWSLA